MIGKIAPKGRGFRGLSAYLLRAGRGQIIAGAMAGQTPRELAKEFGALRQLNPKLTKAVAHLVLSPAPEDPQLTDAQWHDVAHRYMQGMGFGNAPWIAVVHHDSNHQHAHFIACRIGFDGKTVSDANDFRRSEGLVREIETAFGLTSVASSLRANSSRRKADDKNCRQVTNKGDQAMPTMKPDSALLPDDTDRPDTLDATAQCLTESFGAAAPSSAHSATPMNASELREARRLLVEPDYKDRMDHLFGDDLTRVHKSKYGAVLYFKQPGRIVDSGDRLTVMGGMNIQLAALRIVAMGVERGWDRITFAGSASFVESAMREALAAQMEVVAQDAAQEAILAKIKAERRGRMGALSTPRLPAGAVPAAAEIPAIQEPEVVGTLPYLLTLPARISEKRAQRAARDTELPRSPPSESRRRPGT